MPLDKIVALEAVLGNAVRFAGRFEGSQAELMDRLRNTVEGAGVRKGRTSAAVWEKLGWEAVDVAAFHAPFSLGMTASEDETWRAGFVAKAARLRDYTGKGRLGFYRGDRGVPVDLGEHQWRAVDLLKSLSLREVELPLDRMHAGPKALGDGVFAHLRPQTLGMAQGTDTALQCRAAIFNDHGTVVHFLKGLIRVSPEASETVAYTDGYGASGQNWVRGVIHVMDDAEDSNSLGRVSWQARYYEGARGWERRVEVGAVFAPAGEKTARDSARLFQAGLPVKYLPATEVLRLASGLMAGLQGVRMGVRRMVVPGFGLMRGRFRAPRRLRHLFECGRRYLLHRDPALPDGTSAFSALCVGYVAANVFELPTAQAQEDPDDLIQVWEQTGGDFDGDTVLALPVLEDGGVLVGFDQRPPEEQAALLERSGAGRKRVAGVPYPSGAARHAGQLEAAGVLGVMDYRARFLIDEGRSLEAAGLKPFIQVAVDRQKRQFPYPTDWRAMPKLEGAHLTRLLVQLKEGDGDDGESAFVRGYRRHRARMAAVAEIHSGSALKRDGARVAITGNRKLISGLNAPTKWMLRSWALIEGVLEKRGGSDLPAANPLPRGAWARWNAERQRPTSEVASLAAVFQAQILAWRKLDPKVARAAERLAQAWLAEAEDGLRRAFADGLDDFELYSLIAPLEDLAAFTASLDGRWLRAGQLPRIAVLRNAGGWVASGPCSWVFDGSLEFRGRRYEAGGLTLRQVGSLAEVRVLGFRLSSLKFKIEPGDVQGAFEAIADASSAVRNPATV